MYKLTIALSVSLLLGSSVIGYCGDYDVSTSNGTASNNSTGNVQPPKPEEPGTVERMKQSIDQTIDSAKEKLEKKSEQRQTSGAGAVRG